MKLYKMKHLPTGLYYTPSKGRGNLSKKGKIYVGIKPRYEWCKQLRIVLWSLRNSDSKMNQTIRNYFNITDTSPYINKYFQTQESDWLIEEIV